MTVSVTKKSINLREKLSELDKPSGIAGQDILKADTPQEVFNYINAGRRNLIINGAMQVAQRGDYTSATSATNNNYYLDRWRVWSSGVTSNLQQISTNQPNSSSLTKSVRLTATSSATGDLRFNQPIEFPSNYGGQTVTLSAWVKTNSSNCRMYFFNDVYSTSTETDPITADEQWHYTTLTITVATGLSDFTPVIGIDGSASAQVSISSGEYVEITGVQLEVGSVATPFEHRSYGEELALCQRYYYQTDSSSKYRYSMNVAASVTAHYASWTHPVTMRTTPTVSITATTSDNWSSIGTSGDNSPIALGLAFNPNGTADTRCLAEFYFTADAEL